MGGLQVAILSEKALYFHRDKPHRSSPHSLAYLYLVFRSYREGKVHLWGDEGSGPGSDRALPMPAPFFQA